MSTPKLFTFGPATSPEAVRLAGAEALVYHRTPEFSRRVLNCEHMLKAVVAAGPADRALILTASGTGGMEALVLGLFAPGDGLVVINSGDFGQRFADIGRLHGHAVQEIRVDPGRQITAADLVPPNGARGLLVNHHETYTGNLLNLPLITEYCRRHDLLLVVDAIGSFLVDPLTMTGIDALLASSQKGLALPPGLSVLILGPRAQAQAQEVPVRSFYFDLRRALADATRGQTPYTPAISLIRQLQTQLEAVMRTGIEQSVAGVRRQAHHFRAGLAGLPFRVFAECPSNGLTALEPTNQMRPMHYVSELATHYGLYVTPNAGPLSERIFKVGHIGNLTTEDNDLLLGTLALLAKGPAIIA